MSDGEDFDPVQEFLVKPNESRLQEVDDTPAEPEPEATEPEADPVVPTPQEDANDKVRQQTDKALQRLQQLNATYEREMQKFMDRPTESQAKKVEKAKSRLDEIVASGENVDPYKGVVEIADEVRVDRDRQERLLQEFDAYRRETAERQSRLEAQNMRLQFAINYPQLKDKYDEFADKAHEAVEAIFGEATRELDPKVYLPLANREFSRLVQEAAGSVAATPAVAKAGDSAKKPKAATVLNNKSGNSIKPPESRESIEARLLRNLVRKSD